MILTTLASAQNHIHFDGLHLHPVALSLGFFDIKWYSLAYISGILLGWWYLLKLISQPGSPMARRHADDLVFYATLGIILGGRIGYAIFYAPGMFLNPLQILKLWDGGMSFHGGMIGTSLGIILFARRHQLDWLRIHDYLACCVPFGLFFGRLANFVNGELWGKPTDVAWAIVFPRTVVGGLDPARHPSQLYEAGPRRHRAVRHPVVRLLADQGALRSGQARRACSCCSTASPASPWSSSASPIRSSSAPSPRRPACTWASG